jgi:hypothetical protein
VITDRIPTAIAAYREDLANSLKACNFSCFDIVLKILDPAAITKVRTIKTKIIKSMIIYFSYQEYCAYQ